MSLISLLNLVGRNGPFVILSGVVIGLLSPDLADFVRPAFATTVFVFTLGAFMKVDLASLRSEVTRGPRNVGVLAWTTFGIPIMTFTALYLIAPSPGLHQGIFIWSLAPPVGSAAALAAVLGLSPPLALLASVTATVTSPFYMPPMASALGGYELAVDPWAMSVRLLIIVGGACVGSLLLKRLAPALVRNNPDAMTGIAMAAIFINGIGAMQGMQARFLDQPAETAALLLLAYLLNLGFQALGAALFWKAGKTSALTIGLVSGNRNASLAWAAVGGSLLPLGDTFFACSLAAIYTLPAFIRCYLGVQKLFMRVQVRERPAA